MDSRMSNMTSRERVWKAFNHQTPDRVPLDFGSKGSGLAIKTYEELAFRFGVKMPAKVLDQRLGLAVIDDAILDRFQIDTRYVYMQSSKSWDPKANLREDTFVDEWGATLKRPENGLYYDHIGFPIKEPTHAAIKNHKWLDPDDPSRYRRAENPANRNSCRRGARGGTCDDGSFSLRWLSFRAESRHTGFHASG